MFVMYLKLRLCTQLSSNEMKLIYIFFLTNKKFWLLLLQVSQTNITYFHLSSSLTTYRRTSRPTFPCNLCPNGFQNFNDLIAHQKSNHINARFMCHVCGCRYLNNVDLLIHIDEDYQVRQYDVSTQINAYVFMFLSICCS